MDRSVLVEGHCTIYSHSPLSSSTTHPLRVASIICANHLRNFPRPLSLSVHPDAIRNETLQKPRPHPSPLASILCPLRGRRPVPDNPDMTNKKLTRTRCHHRHGFIFSDSPHATAKLEADLELLFKNAKARFPEAVYFKPSSPHAATSPLPYAVPSESAFSLDQSLLPHRTPSPSQLHHQHLIDDDDDGDEEPDTTVVRRSPTGVPDVQLGPSSLLRLTTNINAALIDVGCARGGSQEEQDTQRIDKLRKDLVFMWRSRLYADVRIALTGDFSSSHGTGDKESTTAIFSSHRFLLVSRWSYLKTALQTWNAPQKPLTSPGALALTASRSTADSSLSRLPIAPATPEAPLLTLPSPPFTPASLHFTLGFLTPAPSSSRTAPTPSPPPSPSSPPPPTSASPPSSTRPGPGSSKKCCTGSSMPSSPSPNTKW
ncbi:hypothetical protein D9619_012497 [Psilocybe cf. subviscida]|uniref:Uncharacterized protein n=1 Tax=Psilocybe cf. subviscida TaxID=2480587 RepID=A0A8H5ER99_9AGAR|nr:hypothetical protein D9619_012497 [Psilocybe cf. subviscida]